MVQTLFAAFDKGIETIWVELSTAVSAGHDICQRGIAPNFRNGKVADQVAILSAVSEDAAGVALRGVVAEAIVRYRAVGGIDFGKPCHGLLVKGAVNDPSQCADTGFEEDNTSVGFEHTTKLVKCRLGVFQMVKHIEEDQVRDTLVRKAHPVGVLHLVDPRIGEHIRADALRNMLLEIANPRAQLYNQPLLRTIHLRTNQRVKIIVDGL